MGLLNFFSAHAEFESLQLRPRSWTCLTCKAANLKPSDVTLSSADTNLKCYLRRLTILLKRSTRQQEDILSPCYPVSTRINSVATTNSPPLELAQIQDRLFL